MKEVLIKIRIKIMRKNNLKVIYVKNIMEDDYI